MTATKTRTKTNDPGLFGVVNETFTAPKLEFVGTSEQLAKAMERPWTRTAAPAPAPVVAKRKSKVKSKRPGALRSTRSERGTEVIETRRKYDRHQDGATADELERAKNLITNVMSVPDGTHNKFVHGLDTLTRDITDFLVTEVAPFESALDAALDDAGQMLRLISGAQNLDFTLGRAESIIRRLNELRTIDWVCKRLRIPDDIRALMLSDYMGTDNEKRNSIQELLKLHSATRMPGQQQGRKPRMPKA